MPIPLKHLPMTQNWDCHMCGTCCTDYWIPISESEKKRIEGQGWENEPEFKGRKLFQRYGKWWNRRWRLNHRDGDRCVFLNEKGLCSIHAKFGIDAKPFACRLYPYISASA
jgi:lysine-N-methylase